MNTYSKVAHYLRLAEIDEKYRFYYDMLKNNFYSANHPENFEESQLATQNLTNRERLENALPDSNFEALLALLLLGLHDGVNKDEFYHALQSAYEYGLLSGSGEFTKAAVEDYPEIFEAYKSNDQTKLQELASAYNWREFNPVDTWVDKYTQSEAERDQEEDFGRIKMMYSLVEMAIDEEEYELAEYLRGKVNSLEEKVPSFKDSESEYPSFKKEIVPDDYWETNRN